MTEEPTNYHVVPENDLKPHIESGIYCHCDPEVRLEPPYGRLVIHNSYDGREFFENEGIGH